MYLTGKDELKPLLNSIIISKVRNLILNAKTLPDIDHIFTLTGHINPQNINSDFDSINYYFALKKYLDDEIQVVLKQEDGFIKEENERNLRNIGNFLQILDSKNDHLKNYIKIEDFIKSTTISKTEKENILNGIIDKTEIHLHDQLIEKRKFKMIINMFTGKQDLNESDNFIREYCLIYDFMYLFFNKKNIKLMNKNEVVGNYSLVIKDETELENIKKYKKKFECLITSYQSQFNGSKSINLNEDFKESCFILLNNFNILDEKLKQKTKITINDLDLHYNMIFKSLNTIILKNLYFSDLNLEFSKTGIITTFKNSGFLLDNDLKKIMERITSSFEQSA